jgi:hypothetical protein
MKEKINIAKILKDKPQGTKLYDLLRNIDVKLDEVHITDVGTYIECTSTNEVGSTFLFDYSKLGTEESWLDGLQILLPSKEMRDWSKLAWNTGDILVNKDGNAHVIFEGFDDDTYETFNGNNYLWKNEGIIMCFGEYEDELPTSDFSKANKEDAQKYIRQIEKRLGYKLNFETLKIEKSEFKDGDIVTIIPHIGDKLIYLFKAEDDEKYYGHAFLDGNIAIVNEDSYCQKDFCTARPPTDEEKQQLFSALEKEGKAWDSEHKMIVDLPKNCEFKPFDKVICRDSDADIWKASFFSHYDERAYYPFFCNNCGYKYCLPYNDETAKLIGTTNNVEG